MQSLKTFFAKYSGLTHAIAAAWVFLTGVYFTSAAFHAYVNGIAVSIGHSAPWLAALFVGAIVPIFKYWQGLSDTGKVMVANEARDKAAKGELKSEVPFGGGTKVGALALCSLLVMGTVTGCTSQDAQKAVASVNATLPAVEAAVAIAAQVASALDPSMAALITGANTGIQASLQLLQQECNAYLASPNSGEFAKIISVVDDMVNNGDQLLLQVAHISNSDSQQKALAAISGLDALLHIIDGYLNQAQPASAVKARMAKRTVKLKAVQAYYSSNDKQTIQRAFGQPYGVVLGHAYAAGM